MVGRVYEVPTRTVESRTSGVAGPWQVFEGGLVRVVVQGAGWPTNVLVERVVECFRDDDCAMYSCGACGGTGWHATGERFVRPARGMTRIRS